jgi:hypothetical protein
VTPHDTIGDPENLGFEGRRSSGGHAGLFPRGS